MLFDDDTIVEALVTGPSTRPGRYTVLEHIGIARRLLEITLFGNSFQRGDGFPICRLHPATDLDS